MDKNGSDYGFLGKGFLPLTPVDASKGFQSVFFPEVEDVIFLMFNMTGINLFLTIFTYY